MHATGAGARILVVEDDPLILELVTTRLGIAGYEVFYARDGVSAMERLAEVRPKGMILDINMPRLDGFGVLQKMKSAGLTTSVPTLVLTARRQPEDVRRAVELGAKDFLSKPFDDQQLLARVARLLRKPAPRAEQPSVLI
jgi:two-component system OmpR family response regulator